jgi:hypothetical protein
MKVASLAVTAAALVVVGGCSSSPQQRTMGLGLGCAAGGSIDIVNGQGKTTGYPTVRAVTGRPVVIDFVVADDHGGWVRTAHVSIGPEGTSSGNTPPYTLKSANLKVPTTGSLASSMTFTAPTPGLYPVYVESFQDVSPACAQREIAEGARKTGSYENPIMGWVDAN